MRIVVQRVREASVTIDGREFSSIKQGLLILAGFTDTDTKPVVDRLCSKIVNLRIFSDAEGKMNLSLLDVGGEALAVSQFTLYASTRKGNRPSFVQAAPPDVSLPLYEYFVERLREMTGKPIATGVFGADMKVALLNDGPVTIVIDSAEWEA